ncbi:hypothetical protein GCM10009647_047190 [Streptomyces sanglieri]|uniref:Uncharacterized protein n=1 Tax=Streptomyces sanglieri TaxID=193460 RepID=A0ABW2WNZ7_9ACTN
MTDTTHIRHDQPIEPTTVELSGERTDRATPPPPTEPPPAPPSASPEPVPPPRRRTPPTPPPAGPPAGPPARPPAGPPAPRDGGGVMAPPAPAPVHHHHYYAAPPAQQDRPPRFSVSRLSPVRNGAALVAGLTLLPVSGKAFHVFGDEPGVMMAALAVAGLLELRSNPHDRVRSWLVRVLTCNLLASSVVTPAGLYLYGYLATGVWS